ncbi:MAG TPA: GAF domain-containing protein, partial [Candidatus Eisenbacteria bacterium]
MSPSRPRLSERLTADLLEALRRSGPRTGPAAALEAIHAAAGAEWTGLDLTDFAVSGDGSPIPMAAIGRHPESVAVTDGRSITLPGGDVATIRLEFGPKGGPPAGLPAALDAIEPILALSLANGLLASKLSRQDLLVRCADDLLRRVAGGEGEEQLLGSMCAILLDAFPVDRVSVYSITDDHQWVVRRAVSDRRPAPADAEAPPIPYSEIPAERRRPDQNDLLEYQDLLEADVPEVWRDAARRAGVRSAILAPIVHGGRLWGIVALSRVMTGAVLDTPAAALLSQVLRMTAPILHNERMMRSLSRGLASLEVLLETSREVSSVLDLSEVPRVVARRAMDLTEADEGVVFLVEPGTNRLKPVLALSPFEAEIMNLEIALGEGVTGQVASMRVGEYVNRVDLDPRSKYIPGTPTVPEALLAAPLVCADRLIGVMTLYKLQGRTFDDVELATINIFATQAAIAIENARLFQRMEE